MSSAVNSTLLTWMLAAVACERADLELVSPDRDDIEVVQINGIAGVGDDRAHVAGQEIFVLADAEHERASASRADMKSGMSAWTRAMPYVPITCCSAARTACNQSRLFPGHPRAGA